MQHRQPARCLLVEDVDAYDLGRTGPLLENHPRFPEGANITLAQLESSTAARVRTWERGAGPDPNTELLRESPSDRARKKKPLAWWVYASIIGAVAVGTAIIIANETADDRQRIEVSFP